MNYPAVNVDNAAAELNRLHGEIEQKLRTTVQDAIRAGEILTQVKERLEHGEFLPWIERNCEFKPRTAQEYMGFYRHSDKCASLADLQSARQIVAQIESREKQSEAQKARQRVAEYRKTGVKPEGWRRGTDDRLAQEERERDERIAAARERAEAVQAEREREKKRREEQRASYEQTDEILRQAVEQLSERTDKRQKFKQRIRLSQAGESDQFIDALMEYLEELPDDNRRIESCQNIIKVCRNIAAQLQRDSA